MNTNKTNVTLILALSLLSGLITCDGIQAQTSSTNNQQLDVPINDQARYLRGLKHQDEFQWNFVTPEDRRINNTYQLSISDPDIRIVEQDIPEWRNTGEDADYSVLVDIYEFSDEESLID